MKLSDRPFDQQYSRQLNDVNVLLIGLSRRLNQPRPECACTDVHPCVHHATVGAELALAIVHIAKAVFILTAADR